MGEPNLVRRARSKVARVARRLRRQALPPEDEFVSWVRFAVPGMLAPGNVASFERVMRDLPREGAVLEIGSFGGLSANVIVHLMRKHGHERRPFFTCDRWIFEGSDRPTLGGSHVTHAEYRLHVRDGFLRATRLFSGDCLPHTIELFSDELFEKWGAGAEVTDVFGRAARLGGPLAFCFIDGNHTYDFARRDFENADRWLVPGGFILFDDSGDGTDWEVNRVVHEVVLRRGYEVAEANPNFLVRKRG